MPIDPKTEVIEQDGENNFSVGGKIPGDSELIWGFGTTKDEAVADLHRTCKEIEVEEAVKAYHKAVFMLLELAILPSTEADQRFEQVMGIHHKLRNLLDLPLMYTINT